MKSSKLALPSFFLLFVFLFSPILSTAQTQTGIFRVGDIIKTKYAYNLHTAPGVVSSSYIMAGVQGTINSGPIYGDLGVIWYSVLFETNISGWITEPFIELASSSTPPPPPPTTPSSFSVGDAVRTTYMFNLHSAPGVVSSDYIQAGMNGTIGAGPGYAYGVTFWMVNFGNISGWITEGFIEKTSGQTIPPPTNTTPPPPPPGATTPPPTVSYSGCINFSTQAYTYMGPGTSNTQDVQKIQIFLLERGYLTPIDLIGGMGNFGPRTTSAVDTFLKDAGMGGVTVGGTLAPMHLDKIKNISCTSEGVLWNATPSISSGQSSNLVWKIPGNKNCFVKSTPVDSNWNRGFMGTVSGTRNVNPTSTTVYELICPATIYQSATMGKTTVTVGGGQTTTPTGQGPTVDLKANGLDGVVNLSTGAPLQLSWTVTPATNPACIFEIPSLGINSGIDPYGGMGLIDQNHPFYPNVSGTIYTITCTNSAGQASDSVTVNLGTGPVLLPPGPPIPVLPPPPPGSTTSTQTTTSTGSGTMSTSLSGTTNMTVSSSNVSTGGNVNITWNSSGLSCAGMTSWLGSSGAGPSWTGIKATSGSQTVAINYPTRLLLVCYEVVSGVVRSAKVESIVSVGGVGSDSTIPKIFLGN